RRTARNGGRPRAVQCRNVSSGSAHERTGWILAAQPPQQLDRVVAVARGPVALPDELPQARGLVQRIVRVAAARIAARDVLEGHGYCAQGRRRRGVLRTSGLLACAGPVVTDVRRLRGNGSRQERDGTDRQRQERGGSGQRQG